VTPAETLAVYIALIGAPVFVGVLALCCARAAGAGDQQRAQEEREVIERERRDCDRARRIEPRVRRLREREPVR
jgi:hypothetical protein